MAEKYIKISLDPVMNRVAREFRIIITRLASVLEDNALAPHEW